MTAAEAASRICASMPPGHARHYEPIATAIIEKALQNERERQAKWAEDLIANGVVAVSAEEVGRAIRNNSCPY